MSYAAIQSVSLLADWIYETLNSSNQRVKQIKYRLGPIVGIKSLLQNGAHLAERSGFALHKGTDSGVLEFMELGEGDDPLTLWDAGTYTLKMESVHRHEPALIMLCRELKQAYGIDAWVNGFLNNAGSPSFNEHSDKHDIFLFGTKGVKTMLINGTPTIISFGTVTYMPAGTPHKPINESICEMYSMGIGDD